jgi:hypothetical protein
MEACGQGFLLRALARGVGVHHSGLHTWYRQAVEALFRSKVLGVVVATGAGWPLLRPRSCLTPHSCNSLRASGACVPISCDPPPISCGCLLVDGMMPL